MSEDVMRGLWPFEDPENLAVITLKRILFEGRPILFVTHDEEDGSWQFLDGHDIRTEDAAVCSLKNITMQDPTLLQLADLPLGWQAFRPTPDAPWQRSKSAEE